MDSFFDYELVLDLAVNLDLDMHMDWLLFNELDKGLDLDWNMNLDIIF